MFGTLACCSLSESAKHLFSKYRTDFQRKREHFLVQQMHHSRAEAFSPTFPLAHCCSCHTHLQTLARSFLYVALGSGMGMLNGAKPVRNVCDMCTAHTQEGFGSIVLYVS